MDADKHPFVLGPHRQNNPTLTVSPFNTMLVQQRGKHRQVNKVEFLDALLPTVQFSLVLTTVSHTCHSLIIQVGCCFSCFGRQQNLECRLSVTGRSTRQLEMG